MWASSAVPLRFHDRSKLYQECGRPDIHVICPRRDHLGLRIPTQHTGPCQSPGRLPEYRGTPPVTPAAPLRVDDGASLIQTNRLHFRSPFSRSLRIYDYNPPPEIQFSLTRGVDALAQRDWGSEINFVNAPFRLLNRVLDVIIAQRARATVIAPEWPSQPWFPRLKALYMSPPLRVTINPSTVIAFGKTVEPLKNRRWKMYAWRIFGGLNS